MHIKKKEAFQKTFYAYQISSGNILGGPNHAVIPLKLIIFFSKSAMSIFPLKYVRLPFLPSHIETV